MPEREAVNWVKEREEEEGGSEAVTVTSLVGGTNTSPQSLSAGLTFGWSRGEREGEREGRERGYSMWVVVTAEVKSNRMCISTLHRSSRRSST